MIRALLVCLALILTVSTAFGHAVVYPRASLPGSYEKYVLRVPNERDVPTVRVEIRFQTGLRVVSFSEVSGWTLQLVRDSATNITGAVWSGVLPPERFIEFPFIAVNPKDGATISWPTIQTYQDGERVAWTGPDSSSTPVSTTTIAAAPGTNKRSSAPFYLSGLALVAAIVALGVGLRRWT